MCVRKWPFSNAEMGCFRRNLESYSALKQEQNYADNLGKSSTF